LRDKHARDKKIKKQATELDQAKAKLEELGAEATRLTEQHSLDLAELGRQVVLYSELEQQYEMLETSAHVLVDMLAPEEESRPVVERLAGALLKAEDFFRELFEMLLSTWLPPSRHTTLKLNWLPWLLVPRPGRRRRSSPSTKRPPSP